MSTMPSADVDIHRRLLDLLRLQFCDYRTSVERGSPFSGRCGAEQQAPPVELGRADWYEGRELAMVGQSHHMRGEYPVIVSLAISLGLIVEPYRLVVPRLAHSDVGAYHDDGVLALLTSSAAISPRRVDDRGHPGGDSRFTT